MPEKATMEFEVDQETGGIRVKIEIHSESCRNRNATFTLQERVRVKDRRPIHNSQTPFQHNFRTDQREIEFTIPGKSFSGYWYDGSQIAIECHGTLTIDDVFFVDTTLREQLVCTQIQRPEVRTDAEELMGPHDTFNFSKNMEQISPGNRAATVGLVLLGVVAMGAAVMFGASADMQPTRGGDDEGSWFLASLAGCGVMGAFLWYLIKSQLRQYMTFDFNKIPERIGRKTVVPVKELISGISRCDLHHVVLRVVACNLEKGKYVCGSGSTREVVEFEDPVRCVLLHEQPVDMVPKEVPVENYFEGSVDFGTMFDVLYPPCMIGSSHGVDVQ